MCVVLQYEHGDEESQAAVNKLLPNKVKKRRKVMTEDGVSIATNRKMLAYRVVNMSETSKAKGQGQATGKCGQKSSMIHVAVECSDLWRTSWPKYVEQTCKQRHHGNTSFADSIWFKH